MDSIASRMLTDSVVEVSHLRAERLHLSAEQLSPIIRLLVGFLSFVIVLGFTMLNVGSLSIHISKVVLLTGAVLLLNLGLNDLSWPFLGIWYVSPEPFRELTRVAKVPLRDTERVASLSQPLSG